MKELEIFPNYPIKLEQKYAQRKNFLNFIKKIIFDNNIYIEKKEGNKTNIYNIINEIENGNFLFKQNKDIYKLEGINSHYEGVLNDSENTYHHVNRIQQVHKVIEIYKNYSSLIKSAKNVPKDDIRYFDFYSCENAEEVYDGFERIRALSETKRFANKYLRSYKDLLYTENEQGKKILDEKMIRLFEVIEKQYKEDILSSDEIRQELRKIKAFNKEDLEITLRKIGSKNQFTVEKLVEKIKSEKLNAEVVFVDGDDNKPRAFIKINDYAASQSLGSGQWCISTDDYWYDNYLMEDDTQFYGKHIFCYNFSKEPSDPLYSIAFTINAKGIITEARDKNDDPLLSKIKNIVNNGDESKLNEIIKRSITLPEDQYKNNKEYLNDESVNHDYLAENICYPLVYFNEALGDTNNLPKLSEEIIEETLSDHDKLSLYSDDYMLEQLRVAAIHLKVQEMNEIPENEILEVHCALTGDLLDDIDEMDELDLEQVYDHIGYEKQEYSLNDLFFNTFHISKTFNNASLHYRERLTNYIFENYREDFKEGLNKVIIDKDFSISKDKIKTIPSDTIASNIISNFYKKYKNEINNPQGKIIINTMVRDSHCDKDILDKFLKIHSDSETNLIVLVDFLKELESDENKSYIINNLSENIISCRINPETLMHIINDDTLLKSLSEKHKSIIKKNIEIDAKHGHFEITSSTGNKSIEVDLKLDERIKKIYDNNLMSLKSIKRSLNNMSIAFGDQHKLSKFIKETEETEKNSADIKNKLNEIKNKDKNTLKNN